eukprot:CAMPEP_0194204608 /NCGR_PEP_ID=MMETSP0156-20130528/4079_1 /TAXON_ID=33649 /ORGANISM="Thalassionema nitzschioides, Strain L26-B" /LENGTH=540 /DNA_ID=CAMNT_0038930663 /DNA_START=227 /DNA_END=1849 /DNA_ORIENTATION=-
MRRLESWFCFVIIISVSQFIFLQQIPKAATFQDHHYHDSHKINHSIHHHDNDGNDDKTKVAASPELILDTTSQLPLPNQILTQYMEWHSEEALLLDYRKQRRRNFFVIGHYSCPYQAGNRLNHFFNDMKWAIITNQTLLWKYYDYSTCVEMESSDIRYNGTSMKHCRHDTTEADCGRILRRATWIPSFDEWAPKLLRNEDNYPRDDKTSSLLNNSIHRMHFSNFPSKNEWHVVDNDYSTSTINHHQRQQSRIRITQYPIMVSSESFINQTDYYHLELLNTTQSRERAIQLESLGINYLYGMFYRELFTLTSAIKNQNEKPATEKTTPQQPSSLSPDRSSVNINGDTNEDRTADNHIIFSIGLHSRHVIANQKVRGVGREEECLKEMLQYKQTHQSCTVYVMSDRTWSKRKMSRLFLANYNCTVQTLDHDGSKSISTTSFSEEHGPMAGRAFFEDLDFVAKNTYNAFISIGKGTSSQMIYSVIEYDRYMEAFRKKKRLDETLRQQGSEIVTNSSSAMMVEPVYHCNKYGFGWNKLKTLGVL